MRVHVCNMHIHMCMCMHATCACCVHVHARVTARRMAGTEVTNSEGKEITTCHRTQMKADKCGYC